MGQLLYHDTTTHGMIATSSNPIAGTPYPPRRYQHDGHYVVLEGPVHIIAHDAEEICKIPGYRLATPAEARAYYRAQRGETTLTEDADDPEEKTSNAPESNAPTAQVLTTETAPSERPRSARRKG